MRNCRGWWGRVTMGGAQAGVGVGGEFHLGHVNLHVCV